jgi:hypothetical protein
VAYIHQVPRAFQRAVSLEKTLPGMQCSDCRRELPLGRPWVKYRDEQLCLTDARDRGLVTAVRRPREPAAAPA